MVIVSQSPYPNRNLATGLPFECPPATAQPPKTLQVITQHLWQTARGTAPPRGAVVSPSSWARSGVLLLNAEMIAVVGSRDTAGDGVSPWTLFVAAVMHLVQKTRRVPFYLMGKVAQELLPFVQVDPVTGTQPVVLSHHAVERSGLGLAGAICPFTLLNLMAADMQGDAAVPVDWIAARPQDLAEDRRVLCPIFQPRR